MLRRYAHLLRTGGLFWAVMKSILLLTQFVTVVARFLSPCRVHGLVADNLLMKQQLIILSRARRRARNLSRLERFLPENSSRYEGRIPSPSTSPLAWSDLYTLSTVQWMAGVSSIDKLVVGRCKSFTRARLRPSLLR